MNLGFYYHISIAHLKNEYFAPGYLGVFLIALAKETDNLTILFHEASPNESKDCDFKIEGNNITWINLGAKTPAWHRGFFHQKVLANLKNKLQFVDELLVRAPSPLAPYFHKYFPQKKIWFLIVGDYVDGANQNHSTGFRNNIIRWFLNYNNKQFEKCLPYTNVLVNSPVLFEKYKLASKSIHQVKTTTLSKSDFYERNDTCNNSIIKLLYTGRIDLAKGLLELVKAFEILSQQTTLFELHIVGWEYDTNEPIKNLLENKTHELGIKDKVFFHGKKQVGEELNRMYRDADIYIIPSYHEGFPRTIWEAMANSLPVIATKVGAIPAYLQDGVNALLIDPKNVSSIVDAVNKLVNHANFRQTIIKNARSLVQENTLEFQTKLLVETIQSK